MSDIHLHIVSFDVPYPANYGGVIDVFWKARALTEHGVKVHLHCFEYRRKKTPELERFFYKVHYYKRDISKKHLFKSKPYIIETRHSDELVKNLMKDDYPILMEGLHTTALLSERKLHHRKRIVRTHNIEHDYYNNLSRVETDLFKKYYFFNEAAKLKKYENILSKADLLLTISHSDYKYFSARYKRVVYLPAFHPYSAVKGRTGKGNYVLYHGNLSVPENINAVVTLLREVFSDSTIHFKIAGLNPPVSLVRLVKLYPNAELIASPSEKELQELIAEAHVNIFFTEQATGLKLKLLNALYNGRFVLTNDKMLSGSKLHEVCTMAETIPEMKAKLEKLMKQPFTPALKARRQIHLQSIYTNGNNVERLIELIA
jgi:glycosyltransferase involved in cell wall biosynthesis